MADDPNQDLWPVKEGSVVGGSDRPTVSNTGEDDLVHHHLPTKLSRSDLEDRYLRLCDDNLQLKKKVNKQDDKIKKLATKLIRMVSDQKRQVVPNQRRDVDAEDQSSRLRQLEHENSLLQERVSVLRQQLVAHSQLHARSHCRTVSTRSLAKHIPAVDSSRSVNPSQTASQTASQSPLTPRGGECICGGVKAANQAGAQLLDEVDRLQGQLTNLDHEMENLRERANARISELEEELTATVTKEQKHKVVENVEIIRLRRSIAQQTTQLAALDQQCEVAESEANRAQQELNQARREIDDLQQAVQKEKQRSEALQQQLQEAQLAAQASRELQEEVRDLGLERAKLQEQNSQLLALTAADPRVADLEAQLVEANRKVAELEKSLELSQQQIGVLQRLSESTKNEAEELRPEVTKNPEAELPKQQIMEATQTDDLQQLSESTKTEAEKLRLKMTENLETKLAAKPSKQTTLLEKEKADTEELRSEIFENLEEELSRRESVQVTERKNAPDVAPPSSKEAGTDTILNKQVAELEAALAAERKERAEERSAVTALRTSHQNLLHQLQMLHTEHEEMQKQLAVLGKASIGQGPEDVPRCGNPECYTHQQGLSPQTSHSRISEEQLAKPVSQPSDDGLQREDVAPDTKEIDSKPTSENHLSQLSSVESLPLDKTDTVACTDQLKPSVKDNTSDKTNEEVPSPCSCCGSMIENLSTTLETEPETLKKPPVISAHALSGLLHEKPPNSNVANDTHDKSTEMHDKMTEMDDKVIAIDVKVTEMDDETEMDDNVTEVEDKATEMDNKATEMDDELTEVHDEVTEVDDKATEMDNEVTKMEDKATEMEDKATEMEDKATEMDDKVTEMEDKGTEMEDEVTEMKDEATELEDEVTEIKDTVTEMDDKGTKMDNKVTEKEDKVTEMEDKVTEMDDKSTGMDDEVTEKEDKATETEDTVTEMDDKATGMDDEVTEVNDTAAEVDDKVTKIDDKVTRMDDKVTEMDDKVTEIDDNVTEMDDKATSTSQIILKMHDNPVKATSSSQSMLNVHDPIRETTSDTVVEKPLPLLEEVDNSSVNTVIESASHKSGSPENPVKPDLQEEGLAETDTESDKADTSSHCILTCEYECSSTEAKVKPVCAGTIFVEGHPQEEGSTSALGGDVINQLCVMIKDILKNTNTKTIIIEHRLNFISPSGSQETVSAKTGSKPPSPATSLTQLGVMVKNMIENSNVKTIKIEYTLNVTPGAVLQETSSTVNEIKLTVPAHKLTKLTQIMKNVLDDTGVKAVVIEHVLKITQPTISEEKLSETHNLDHAPEDDTAPLTVDDGLQGTPKESGQICVCPRHSTVMPKDHKCTCDHGTATGSAKKMLDVKFSNIDTEEKTSAIESGKLADKVEAAQELEKCRELLRVQYKLNSLYKKELADMTQQLSKVDTSRDERLEDMSKLLEAHSEYIQKLQTQMNADKTSSKATEEATRDHSRISFGPGQGLFEIHIQRLQLGDEILSRLNSTTIPSFFVTWMFFDKDVSSTPVKSGLNAEFDSSTVYRIDISQEFLDYLQNGECQMDVHHKTEDASELVAQGTIQLSSLLELPGKKLNVTLPLLGTRSHEEGLLFGVLHCWFQLSCDFELLKAHKLELQIDGVPLSPSGSKTAPVPPPRELREPPVPAPRLSVTVEENTEPSWQELTSDANDSKADNEASSEDAHLDTEKNSVDSITREEEEVNQSSETKIGSFIEEESDYKEVLELQATALLNQIVIEIHKLELYPDCAVMQDPEVQQCYVEFTFLGHRGAELETASEPKDDGKMIFDYKREFTIGAKGGVSRQMLAQMLQSSSGKSKMLRFIVISEPLLEESEKDCVEIGVAEVDLFKAMLDDRNLELEEAPVYSLPDNLEIIGTLTVSIKCISNVKSSHELLRFKS